MSADISSSPSPATGVGGPSPHPATARSAGSAYATTVQADADLVAHLAAKELSVSWTSTFDGKLLLDTERILRVLINLVDNAYKACSRGGRIDVEARKVDENLRISVKDDGIGMDSETQRHIFDPFYSKSERGGTGLGLHIVGTIVSAHGGTVDIQSAPGTGTEVSFTLPLRL